MIDSKYDLFVNYRLNNVNELLNKFKFYKEKREIEEYELIKTLNYYFPVIIKDFLA